MSNTTYLEIGSEFWSVKPIDNDTRFFLSGRTALDYIIRDIKKKYPKINSVLLPSYCCDSMIYPIINNGLSVRFYDVLVNEDGIIIELPEAIGNEVFYLMSYFGFNMPKNLDIKYVRSKWNVIIEDQTHSCFRDNRGNDCVNADYVYMSYRKWNAFAGISKAVCVNERFDIPYKEKINKRFTSLRIKGEKLKKSYIEGNSINKNDFLLLFNEAEAALDKDYKDYTPLIFDVNNIHSLDTKKMRLIRQRNASVLIKGLKCISALNLIYSNIESADCPLFVPLYVKKDRDKLKKYLIQHNVFCPINWPISNYHNGISNKGKDIYMHELSLVCDQRYGESDMEHIVDLIKEFYKEEEIF